MNEASFLALKLTERVELLRSSGDYLGSRRHTGHQVHLYSLGSFYVEMWMRLGLRQVEWVEVLRNTDILSEYVDLDPDALFGP